MADFISIEEFIERIDREFNTEAEQDSTLEELEIEVDVFVEFLETEFGLDSNKTLYDVKEDMILFALHGVLF